ncbi:ParB/RepB/Spo0J family partition protein [Clostridium uliginosum]|uniref:ParB/RepB/Spo0J family partition protein n=2 Tax=Clostridium uliginosum TaxID=119641 RepID=A0A1I1IZ02_9CLOT|nr:ParB/RepB/Spo0J family partition protein [Clostridium uliginosum]
MIITEIPINKIKIDVRLWEVEQEHIEPIVASIKQVGLINPITVLEDNGEYTLVAGEHRLRAYVQLGKETIPTNVFPREYEDLELDKAKCVIREVDENLTRRSSDAYEESYMLYQRKIAYEKLYTESTVENRRKISGKVIPEIVDEELPKSFTKDTAEKTGLDISTIAKKVRIGSIIDEKYGKKADSLGISTRVLRTIVRGNDTEQVKESAKIHIDNIEELNKYFVDEKDLETVLVKKRNKFYNDSLNKLRKEKEEKYHLTNPVEFANELKGKISNEYLAEYIDSKVENDQKDLGLHLEEPQCTYEKTDNILICDTVYAKQFPEVCNRFMTIHVNNESEFEIVSKVINTFGQEVKIAIICLNAMIFSKYINY